MRTSPDLSGQRFGRLVVIGEAPRQSPRHRQWVCRCDCGRRTQVRQDHLGKQISSCGCLRLERTIAAKTTHGRTKTREYETWRRILDRCYNPNNQDFAEYGGRGIVVCDRWRHNFEHFYADMGPRPTPGLYSLDRFPDNDGPYAPENCRWATPAQQAHNRRNRGFSKWHPKPRPS